MKLYEKEDFIIMKYTTTLASVKLQIYNGNLCRIEDQDH